MAALMKIVTASPNRIFTLSHFCDLFGAAKSTMSEDIDLLQEVLTRFHGAALACIIAGNQTEPEHELSPLFRDMSFVHNTAIK